MNTIQGEIIYEIEIKKSRFICYIKHVSSVEEAKEYIDIIKKKHEDARHNCSAYIVGINKKADDDGEPSNTAGVPMLGVLEHHDIDNVVCVVTRYFGGIKLGAGGLIRAYAKSVSQAINSTTLINLVQGTVILIEVGFDANDSLNYYLKKHKLEIIEKQYFQKVTYKVKVKNSEFEEVQKDINGINHLIKITKIEDVMMVDYEK